MWPVALNWRVSKPHAANSLPRLAMRRLLLEALRDGPKGGVAAARYVAEHQPSISYREAQRRVHQALTRMVANGFAVKGGGVWRGVAAGVDVIVIHISRSV